MRPTISRSSEWQLVSTLRSRGDDEETEEVPPRRQFAGTASTCASPTLWKRDSSLLSSFRSSVREDEELASRRSKQSASERTEAEIYRIALESNTTKGYLREFARQLQARTDEAKTSSVASLMEQRAMRDYISTLNTRLDKLINDTTETVQALTTPPPPMTVARASRRARTSGTVYRRASQPLECRLETEATKPGCCALWQVQ